MKKFLPLLLVFVHLSCAQEFEPVDLMVQNAKVYTVNDSFDVAEAFVVKDGMIVEVGTTVELQGKYAPNEIFEAGGETIVPGLIDAHAHLYNLGAGLQEVDLVGTTSYS